MRLFLLLIFSWTVLGLVQCYLERHRPNKNFLVEVPSDYERKFKPDWSDLDRRPLPRWYDQAKIGIFLHWGVYSVPSFYGEWFWLNWKGGNKEIKEFMSKNYPPNFTYQDFAPMFKAEFFNPKKLADLFSQSGARYVVLTSKHHEGYTLFPSKRSFSWNSVDVGPGRDLVKDMATAVRNAGLKFGVYHSLYEWFNPIYLSDKSANFTRQDYIESKLWPDIKQLIYDYQPSILWSDGDWEANDTYWKSPQLLSWLYNESPVKDEVVVNDRWGKGIACHHGDFYNCADRYNPGSLQNHKWENAFTMDKSSWGFRREMEISDVYTMKELLKNVISTVSCGGNALINVGPTKEGTIAPIFQDRLQALGEWLDVNGEGIYGSSPWTSQNDTFNSNVWYTCTRTTYNPHKPTAKPVDMESIMNVYAFLLEWPDTNILELGDVVDLLIVRKWKITMLGVSNATLKWVPMPGGKIGVNLPEFQRVKTKHAWTLVFSPPENY